MLKTVIERKETEHRLKESCRHGLRATVTQERLVPPGDPVPKVICHH